MSLDVLDLTSPRCWMSRGHPWLWSTMMESKFVRLLAVFALCAGSLGAGAQSSTGSTLQTSEKPDLRTQPRLYVVGYAHLDTEWRWERNTAPPEWLNSMPDRRWELGIVEDSR
jgi:hypothetical protein